MKLKLNKFATCVFLSYDLFWLMLFKNLANEYSF